MSLAEARAALAKEAKSPVVVTIDLHRGHLDPEVATLPLPEERCAPLVGRCEELLAAFRSVGVPVVHVVTVYRDESEVLSNRYWRFQAQWPESPRHAIAKHNVGDVPGLELMPGLLADGDVVVTTKKRYDCFAGTDLEQVLAAGGYDSLLVLGVNTNSCVLATSVTASIKDYGVFVIEDGVDSMLGRESHEAALSVLRASFAWVLDGDSALGVLRAGS